MDLAEMWDFDRPGVSEERFRAALDTATGTNALVLRTQLARALGLQRRFAEATAELDAVSAELGAVSAELDAASADLDAVSADLDAVSLEDADPLVRTYLELERGRVLNSSGDRDAARPHFLGALVEAEAAGLDYLAADAAHMMAIVEPGAAQIPWAERALAIADASEDPRARRWIGSVSHNLGWTLHDLGRYEDALVLWQRALLFREEQGEVGPLNMAWWTVGRGMRSLGRYEEALAIQQDLAGKVDSDGYVQEELGELMLALGRPDEAAPHFARAYEVLSADEWLAGSEPDRIARLAKLGGTPAEADPE